MNAEIPAAVELQRVLPTRGTGLEVLAKGGSLLRAHFQYTQNIFKASDTEGELGDSCLRYLRRQLVLLKGKFVTNATLSQPGISQLRTLQEQKKPVDCLFENLLDRFLGERQVKAYPRIQTDPRTVGKSNRRRVIGAFRKPLYGITFLTVQIDTPCQHGEARRGPCRRRIRCCRSPFRNPTRCRSLSKAMRPRSSPLTIQLNCTKREPRQSQHLNPRRIMKNTIRIAVALVLIIGTGLVHGTWTNRWRLSPGLTELAARLNTVPEVLGDWKATSRRELPPRELAMTGAVGYISRTYTNPSKALAVSVLLLSGLPGTITTHTPDACYPGVGYTLGNAEKFELKYGAGQRAEFQTAVASRDGAHPSHLRLYWSWCSSKGWSAPEDARWALAAEPMLSKLYVVRETVGAKIAPKDDPCDEFMTLLLPALDRAMSDPTKQPDGNSTSQAPER